MKTYYHKSHPVLIRTVIALALLTLYVIIVL